jgi:T4 gene Gp59 loader of gp41 DNA helicase/T4 gene Gp59 loader of gp41 DNA helicase C-term
MMSAFECYKEYVALKNHFTQSSYDYFKYNGKSKASPATFEARKDKLYFQKLAKHSDPRNYLLANLVENPKIWIKEISFSLSAEQTYKDWAKRQQSLLYIFKEHLSKLNEDFDSNFKVENQTHPYVVKLYLRKEISLETLILLCDLCRCIAYWSKRFEYDPTVQDVITKITKYRPFLQYDREKVKDIVVDKFSQ